MKITQEQIERIENPIHSLRRKIKDIVVQYKSNPDKLDGTDKWGSIFMGLHKDWSTKGKYEKIEDAIRALETIDKKDHIYRDFEYRVLIKKKQILENWKSPHDLAEQLKIYAKENS